MIQRNRKVTIRLTEQELDSIEILAQKTANGSVSDFIRDAIDFHVERATAPMNLRTVVVKIPTAVYDRCSRLVQAGEGHSVESELVRALEKHLVHKTEEMATLDLRLRRAEENAVRRNVRTENAENGDQSGADGRYAP